MGCEQSRLITDRYRCNRHNSRKPNQSACRLLVILSIILADFNRLFNRLLAVISSKIADLHKANSQRTHHTWMNSSSSESEPTSGISIGDAIEVDDSGTVLTSKHANNTDGCGVAGAFCSPPAINSDQVKGMLLGKWLSISICVLKKIYMMCTFLYFCNANNREALHTFFTSSNI